MAVDFKALLSKPSDQIERPKPLPAGTYQGIVKSYKFDESKEKKTPFIRFELGILAAGEDVDPSALVGMDMSKKGLRKDFYLTDDAIYRLDEFVSSIDKYKGPKSLAERVPDTLNAQVLIYVTQRNSQDGTEVYNDVGNVKGM